jgi:hypothetical protein
MTAEALDGYGLKPQAVRTPWVGLLRIMKMAIGQRIK